MREWTKELAFGGEERSSVGGREMKEKKGWVGCKRTVRWIVRRETITKENQECKNRTA